MLTCEVDEITGGLLFVEAIRMYHLGEEDADAPLFDFEAFLGILCVGF